MSNIVINSGKDSPRKVERGGCDWVRPRLARYWAFELATPEFRHVEEHLTTCPGCATTFAELREAMDGAAIEEFGLAAMSSPEATVREIICRELADDMGAHDVFQIDGCGEGRGSNQPPRAQEDTVSTCAPASGGAPVDRGRSAVSWWRAAAAILLLAATPVLAYMGARVLLTKSDGRTAELTRDSVSTDQAADHGVGEHAWNHRSDGTPPAVPHDARPDPESDLVSIDAIAATANLQLELAALVPDTEEEYEAWARKEYPHIMGLYDILTDKHGLMEVQRGQSRNVLDTGGDGSWPIFEANVEELLPWDGLPTNIPDWGRRLYKDTSEAERPTGWRALLIYSGEIFKFDWPTSPEEPNCGSTQLAIEQAAAVAGFAVEFSDSGTRGAPRLPHTDVDEYRLVLKASGVETLERASAAALEVSETHITTVAADTVLSRDALRYFGASSSLLGTPSFDGLARDAYTLLEDHIVMREFECNEPSWRLRFSTYVVMRGRLVGLTCFETPSESPLIQEGISQRKENRL